MNDRTRQLRASIRESIIGDDLDRVSANVPRGHESSFGTYRLCLQCHADHWSMHRDQPADARRAAGVSRMWL